MLVPPVDELYDNLKPLVLLDSSGRQNSEQIKCEIRIDEKESLFLEDSIGT